MEEDIEDVLDRAFTYHPPKGDQVERYQRIRDAAREFAEVVIECTPRVGRYSLIEKIQETVMKANACIAQNEVWYTCGRCSADIVPLDSYEVSVMIGNECSDIKVCYACYRSPEFD